MSTIEVDNDKNTVTITTDSGAKIQIWAHNMSYTSWNEFQGSQTDTDEEITFEVKVTGELSKAEYDQAIALHADKIMNFMSPIIVQNIRDMDKGWDGHDDGTDGDMEELNQLRNFYRSKIHQGDGVSRNHPQNVMHALSLRVLNQHSTLAAFQRGTKEVNIYSGGLSDKKVVEDGSKPGIDFAELNAFLVSDNRTSDFQLTDKTLTAIGIPAALPSVSQFTVASASVTSTPTEETELDDRDRRIKELEEQVAALKAGAKVTGDPPAADGGSEAITSASQWDAFDPDTKTLQADLMILNSFFPDHNLSAVMPDGYRGILTKTAYLNAGQAFGITVDYDTKAGREAATTALAAKIQSDYQPQLVMGALALQNSTDPEVQEALASFRGEYATLGEKVASLSVITFDIADAGTEIQNLLGAETIDGVQLQAKLQEFFAGDKINVSVDGTTLSADYLKDPAIVQNVVTEFIGLYSDPLNTTLSTANLDIVKTAFSNVLDAVQLDEASNGQYVINYNPGDVKPFV